MDKFVFILIFPLFTIVTGNITVCKSLDDKQDNIEDYSLLVKSVKQELTTLLEDSSSKHYEHFDFDFHHPALSMKGELNDVTLENMDKFDMDFFNDIDLTENHIEIFSLTFKNISTVGKYNMTGNIGDLFDIWGVGNFWTNTLNFSVSARTKLPIINSTAVCIFLDINVKLEAMKGWFYNLMDGDTELEEVINHSIAGIAPEAVEVIWGEVKDAVDGSLEEWLNSVINKHSLRFINDAMKKSMKTEMET